MTEISYRSGKRVEGDVVFLEKAEWEEELEVLLRDLYGDEPGDGVNTMLADIARDGCYDSGDIFEDMSEGRQPQHRRVPRTPLAKAAWSKVRAWDARKTLDIDTLLHQIKLVYPYLSLDAVASMSAEEVDAISFHF